MSRFAALFRAKLEKIRNWWRLFDKALKVPDKKAGSPFGNPAIPWKKSTGAVGSGSAAERTRGFPSLSYGRFGFIQVKTSEWEMLQNHFMSVCRKMSI